ncbi:FCD domain-containing protein [Aurantimonas aggregata]|uniref:FCD domain-containing protein n=1 Tax=Aurantimonas aggregata TaxID=2047720 RepID=A0A6L9MKE6_9HYPH|nr:GntR family transcriptional regulator [Aurantimonas aggregata]NDV88215.1 FCD domain-containing protein [Aurantimonas aggregata]
MASLTVMDSSLKAGRAYEAIHREIVSCRLFPGAIMSEPDFMDRFEIGKATCRIALQRLIHDGLVTSIPRQGYRIAPVTLKDIDEVFQLRLAIEPFAARAAVGRIKRSQLERLERACRIETSSDVGNQIDFFLEANRSFHMAIAVATGNERLCRTLGNLLDEMTRLVALGFGVQGVRPNIESDHIQIIEYLDAGDADGAERIARQHVEVFREMTIQKVLASLRDTPELALRNLATKPKRVS